MPASRWRREADRDRPSGVPLRAWSDYADALAAAPDGSVIVGEHGAALQRITSSGISQLIDFTKTRPAGYGVSTTAGAFEPEGVAVGPDSTIYADTAGGDGWTDVSAIAQITPAGGAAILPITTPITATLPAVGAAGFPAALYPEPLPAPAGGQVGACPSPTRLEAFDAAARAAAIETAKRIDSDFYQGLRSSDRAWWRGLYTDQINAAYQIGRHAVAGVERAGDDICAPAVRAACGAALLRRSLVVVIGRSAYSFQVSHLYVLDRDRHALLYWQHT